MLALLGGVALCVAGIAARRDDARLALVSGLLTGGLFFCAGFIILIIVAHYGTT